MKSLSTPHCIGHLVQYLVPNNLGVVTYFGASVVKIAGLQQACISEVLLIDNRGADIGVMIVQVLSPAPQF